MILEPIIQAKAKENQKLSEGRGEKGLPKSDNLNPIHTNQELAKVAGVSHDTIDKTEKILTKGTPEQIQRARQSK